MISTSLTDTFRQAGVYAGRISKGTKPADLPITWWIDLKIARALSLDVPPMLFAHADGVIE